MVGDAALAHGEGLGDGGGSLVGGVAGQVARMVQEPLARRKREEPPMRAMAESEVFFEECTHLFHEAELHLVEVEVGSINSP